MGVFVIDNKEFYIEERNVANNRLSGIVNEEKVELNLIRDGDNVFLERDGVFIPIFFVRDDKNNLYLHIDGETYIVHQKTIEEQAERGGQGASSGDIEPPMPGKILKILVKEGEKVEENQVLILMESMKLQVELKAPFNGIVKELKVKEGETVNAGEVVVKIEKND